MGVPVGTPDSTYVEVELWASVGQTMADSARSKIEDSMTDASCDQRA